jgi:hypothetical protein
VVRNASVIENKITHVVLILDESLSMTRHRSELIKVVDGQVKYLARRSQELDQETRVSIYTFSDQVRCLVYDKDVLRLPSIASLYNPGGMTALIDATIKALADLGKTPELYGEHAFLAFALTDGEENASRNRPSALIEALKRLPDHWTVGVLVPDMKGKHEAQMFGFPPANIAVWDADTTEGVQEAGQVIQRATENFMTGRSKGVRSTKDLFSLGADIDRTAVRRNLTALDKRKYDLIPVFKDDYIRPYVESRGLSYDIGNGYYQLMKPERIQSGKKIAIREKATGKVYSGPEARNMLGLPDTEVKVKPDVSPDFDIFIQSTSVNRKLIQGTELLYMR